MARTPRSYLSGAVFHLTARTQTGPWFTPPLRDRITASVAQAIRVSDARLLAYAIMPNHLHLVLQQGEWPLGRIMQPLSTGIAVLVKKTHHLKGHVFEGRFKDRHCADPYHARNAIIYVNLNPVRAGLVDQADAYRWTSHRMYVLPGAGPPCMEGVLDVPVGLRLFAGREANGLAGLRESYIRHIAGRMERDRLERGGEAGQEDDAVRSTYPLMSMGDAWSRDYGPLFRPHRAPPNDDLTPLLPRREPRDIARQVMAEHYPGLDLERVRSAEKTRVVVRARRHLAAEMKRAGHKGCAIARYLRVSQQCVSNLLTVARREDQNGTTNVDFGARPA